MVRKFIARDRKLELGEQPRIMGVLNVTPDSFSDGGLAFGSATAIEWGMMLVKEGADIIDIGGESTRPGSEPVSLNEELRRVIPVIRELRNRCDVLISIDTTKAEVAGQALDAGAHIINDISGGSFDPAMTSVAKEYGAGVVLMHIKGTPSSMQNNPEYVDVVAEVKDYLEEAVEKFIDAGLRVESILVDPGIGFGKTLEHNLVLMNKVAEFKGLGIGVLVGPSRKSFIGSITGKPVTERLGGTIGAVIASYRAGADVFRVHDVAEVIDALEVANYIDSVSK